MKLMTIFSLLLAGCVTTQSIDVKTLAATEIDCANKEAQIRYFQAQITPAQERAAGALGMTSVSELLADWNAEKTQTGKDRQYTAIGKRKIWELRTQCPKTAAEIAADDIPKRQPR